MSTAKMRVIMGLECTHMKQVSTLRDILYKLCGEYLIYQSTFN
jgi:hypothetical protein